MKTIVRIAALLCGTSIAQAADLPIKGGPVERYTPAGWTGFFIEGYGLYGVNFTGTTVDIGSIPLDISTAPHGPGIGGALGYLYQAAPNGFVFGVRADLAYANLRGSGQIGNGVLSVSNATNYLGNVNLIGGVPLSQDGRLLGYVDGGFAWGGAKPNLNVGSLSAAVSDTATGWDIGAGLDYKLTPNWVVGIEGRYYQLGDKTLTIPSIGTTSNSQFKIVEQLFRLRYAW